MSGVLAVAAMGAAQTISTVAGNGSGGYSGDGGLATSAKLYEPRDVVPTPDGGFLVADSGNDRIRKVAAAGTISTVAGSTEIQLEEPSAVAMTRDGGFLIADTQSSTVRKVAPDGTITTVAGTGSDGYGGDGGQATAAQLNEPYDVAPLPDGGFLIADHGNDRIRKVDAAGKISTVAGTGSGGFNGDGIAATAAKLDDPHDVAPLADGGYLIADALNHRVRRVTPGGLISTVAGTASSGYSGDGGPATAAKLNGPHGLAPTASGGFLISDLGNAAIRYVAPDGTISTVAGTGAPGNSGDGGTATSAKLDRPQHLSLTAEGDVLVADSGNHRIRRIDASFLPLDLFAPIAPPADNTTPPGPGGGPAPNSPAETKKPQPQPGLDPPDAPEVGRDLNATPQRGTVLVKLPGSSRFVDLSRAASLPMGSLIDATRGAVKLTSARDRRGHTQRAVFHDGAFEIAQKRSARPITDLLMRGGNFTGCKPAKTALSRSGRLPATAARSRSRRKLWGSGQGRFRTRGRRGAATVRGTIWLTEDRCDGTRVAVRRGRVAVRDFAARKTVLVRAGSSYLARARR